MNTIQLYTKTHQYVTEVLCPPFMQGHFPDVIVWGERFFRKETEETYIECFAIVAFTKEEWKKKL